MGLYHAPWWQLYEEMLLVSNRDPLMKGKTFQNFILMQDVAPKNSKFVQLNNTPHPQFGNLTT